MSTATIHRRSDQPRVGEAGQNTFGLDKLGPLLLGFVAPLIALVLVDPALLRDGRELLLVLLMLVMFVACGLFAYGVFMPKNLSSLRIDATRRVLELVYSNALAEETDEIAFAQVADIRVATAYDRDGYSANRYVIVERDGEQTQLPAGVFKGNIEKVRRIIGVAG